jgi:hypothetical protein
MNLQAQERSHEQACERALSASTLSLMVALACIALFLPPLVHSTVSSPWRPVLVGVVLATALVLHWVFLAVAARRMGRSVGGWVALSVLLLPVGSAAALILLTFFSGESSGAGAGRSSLAAHG